MEQQAIIRHVSNFVNIVCCIAHVETSVYKIAQQCAPWDRRETRLPMSLGVIRK